MSIIGIENFSFTYPRQTEKILNQINLTIEEGSFNVLFGKSGCGKTTLLRHLKPVIAPHGEVDGKIVFQNEDIKNLNTRRQSEEIGYVLQNPDNQIVTDKVWHELAFGLESLGFDSATIRLRVAEMASYFGIQHWFMKDVTELSGGQKQLLNLASVMVLHPKLLILDEPTSQLDPIAASEFLETVHKINQDIGTTIIITEHRLQEVLPMADHLILMDQGEIHLHGTPQEVSHQMHQTNDDLFIAMPAPLKIFLKTQKVGTHYPITVREGRIWLESLNLAPISTEIKESAAETGSPLLQVKDIWFRYERDGKDVVKDLNFEVYPGEFFGLVGGNGTGKSTTLSLISRIYRPYRGKILLEGKNINKLSSHYLYHNFLGVLPQNPQSLFVRKTVLEDLYEMIDGPKEKKTEAYALSMEKKDAVAGVIQLTHLEHLLDRHPYDLSGGEQQRLALAKILLLRPKVLLLDEPTKGLDDFYKQEFGQILQELKEQGVSIIMVSHDVEFVAEHADRCGLFFEGNIATIKSTRAFFSGNSFYTTASNRLARKYFPEAVTVEEVVACLNQQKTF